MDYQIGYVEDDVVVKVETEDATEEFSIKTLINLIIEFINKLLKFEF